MKNPAHRRRILADGGDGVRSHRGAKSVSMSAARWTTMSARATSTEVISSSDPETSPRGAEIHKVPAPSVIAGSMVPMPLAIASKRPCWRPLIIAATLLTPSLFTSLSGFSPYFSSQVCTMA